MIASVSVRNSRSDRPESSSRFVLAFSHFRPFRRWVRDVNSGDRLLASELSLLPHYSTLHHYVFYIVS